jgi:hypothetical protein
MSEPIDDLRTPLEQALEELRRERQALEEKCQREHGCSATEYMDRLITQEYAKRGFVWVDEEIGWVRKQ